MEGEDKLLVPIAGKPLLTHTLRAFEESPVIEQIVVVLSDANAAAVLPLLRPFKKVTRTCRGGVRRQDSVRNGLYSLPACEWVVIHDGARPLVTPGLISHGLDAARRTGAAAAAVPLVDTIKAAREDGTVLRTVPREGLWAVQTPQIFRYDLLLTAHEQVNDDVTDDCAMIERLGRPVVLYEGSRLNIKVTTPDDVRLVEAVVRSQRARGSRGRRLSTDPATD